MGRNILICALVLLATSLLVNGGNYLCKLSEDDFTKALDCIHETVSPEVAKFMERFHAKGALLIRSLCKMGSDIDRIMPLIYTEDYMREFLKADEKCQPK